MKPCKKSTSVLRRADTELGFAPTNSPVVIRVPATGAQEQQRQQLPQRTWVPHQRATASSSSQERSRNQLRITTTKTSNMFTNTNFNINNGIAMANRRSLLSNQKSVSKVQEALRETSGIIEKPLTKAPRRAGKTSSSDESSTKSRSSKRNAVSRKKVVSPQDLTDVIDVDIKKTRAKPRNREEAFVQWAEYSPPFIAIGTACVALAVALLAIAESTRVPCRIHGQFLESYNAKETKTKRGSKMKKGSDRPRRCLAESRCAAPRQNDDAASSEKLSSPKTPEFKQSEKERIRLAQEERERVVTEKIRAEFEKENEVRGNVSSKNSRR